MRLERTLIMSPGLDELLGGILEEIGEVVPFSTGAIFTAEAERLTPVTGRGKRLPVERDA